MKKKAKKHLALVPKKGPPPALEPLVKDEFVPIPNQAIALLRKQGQLVNEKRAEYVAAESSLKEMANLTAASLGIDPFSKPDWILDYDRGGFRRSIQSS